MSSRAVRGGAALPAEAEACLERDEMRLRASRAWHGMAWHGMHGHTVGRPYTTARLLVGCAYDALAHGLEPERLFVHVLRWHCHCLLLPGQARPGQAILAPRSCRRLLEGHATGRRAVGRSWCWHPR